MQPLSFGSENVHFEGSTTPYTELHKGCVKLLLPSRAEYDRGLWPFYVGAAALRVGSDSLVAFKERNPLAVGWWGFNFWAPTHQLEKSLSKAAGEKVVDDRIDGRAEVKQHSGEDMHVLKDVVHVVGPISDETPQESVNMEWSPADSKGQHHDSCSK